MPAAPPSANGTPTDRQYIRIDGREFPQDAREAARVYLRAGLPVVPVPARTKGEQGMPKGWPDLRLTEADVDAHFLPGSNVGLLLGAGGLLDLDLDCPEASAAAGVLMPTRANSCGRKSKQRSHIFYRNDLDYRPVPLKLRDPVREAELADPARKQALADAGVDPEHYALVLEIRAGRAMTVVPPSVHGSGERLFWREFREDVPHIGAKQLHALAGRLAAAALIGRYWSGVGRHDASLALAGGLLRAGWDASLAETFVRGVCAAAGDEEVEDRVRAVADTAEKLKAGKEVTGWPTLAEQLGANGDAIVSAARGWLGIVSADRSNSNDPRATFGKVESAPGGAPQPKRYIPLPEWKPFPVDVLPGPWAEFARRWAAALSPQCDPAYVALPVVAVLAAAVGNARKVCVKHGWFEPAVWWSCIIGTSGTVKSPAAEVAVRLVQAVQEKYLAEYRRALADYKQELSNWKTANKGKKNDPDAEGRPQPPKVKRLIVSDITIEKLSEMLEDNPRGLLAYRDELSGWFGSFKRYKGKGGGSDEPNWLSIHGAKAITYDRKTGDRTSVYVPHAAVSVTGTIQPKVLAALLGQESFDSGLVARVTMAFPPRAPKRWSDASVPEELQQAAEKSLASLLALSGEVDEDDNLRPVLVKLSPEARARFKRFVNEWGERQFQTDDELAAALAKLEGMAARFALIHHVVTKAPELEDTDPIGVESVEAGIRLVEWQADETERVYMMLAETDDERTTNRLVDLVRRVAARNGGRVTVKQLQRANQRKYRRKEAAEADLEYLRSIGVGEWEDPPARTGGGRRTKSFVLCVTHDVSDPDPDDEGGADTDPRDDCPNAPDECSGDAAESADATNEKTTGNVHQSGPVGIDPSETSSVTHNVEAESGFVPDGRSVETGPEPNVTHPPQPDLFRLVTRVADLDGMLSRVEESAVIGLDTETTGLDPRADRVRLLTLSLETIDGGRLSYLLDLFALPAYSLPPLWEMLAAKELVGHNLLFDLGFLVPLGFSPGRVWDTMLASQVLDAGDRAVKHGLKDVAARHLREDVCKEEQTADWSKPLTPGMLRYTAADAELPVRLRETLMPKVAAAKLGPVADLEMRALPCVVWASGAGVQVDRDAWLALATEAESEAARCREALDAAAPNEGNLFQSRNWNSPEQVGDAFTSLGIPLDTTDDNTLAAIEHPLAGLVRDYRATAKRAGTYGRAWLGHVAPDGRVRPGWKQIGAGASGRMSCKEPNLQNLPRDPRYRRCFVAPHGRVLVKADYSQIELRLAAKVAHESRMLDAYRRGDDLHSLTARTILGKDEVNKADRQLAKAVNFGLLYGMGSKGFRVYARSNYGVSLTPDEATAYREKFFAAYPALRAWHQRQPDARTDTRTVLGRRRLKVERFTEKLNTPVQGSGADGLKAAMALLWERRAECPSAVPVLFVHDEIVVECDEADAGPVKGWLTRAMADGMAPFADPVPVAVEATVGKTWGG